MTAGAATAAAVACGGLLIGACLGLVLLGGDAGSLYRGGADKGVRRGLALLSPLSCNAEKQVS